MNLQQISLYLADVEVPLVNQTIDLSSVTQERVLRLQIAAGAIERLSEVWRRSVHSQPVRQHGRPFSDIRGRQTNSAMSATIHDDGPQDVAYAHANDREVLYLAADQTGASGTDVLYRDVLYANVFYHNVTYVQASSVQVNSLKDKEASDGAVISLTGQTQEGRRVVVCLSDIVGLDMASRDLSAEEATVKLKFAENSSLDDLVWIIQGHLSA